VKFLNHLPVTFHACHVERQSLLVRFRFIQFRWPQTTSSWNISLFSFLLTLNHLMSTGRFQFLICAHDEDEIQVMRLSVRCAHLQQRSERVRAEIFKTPRQLAPHPPYSLDLTPSDLVLFGHLKSQTVSGNLNNNMSSRPSPSQEPVHLASLRWAEERTRLRVP
jgi:hypothetical protein